MGRKFIVFIVGALCLCMLAGCAADASEGVFTVPDEPHRIEGTVIYNDINFFEGLYMDMPYDEYINLIDERYGDGCFIQSVTSSRKNTSYTWQIVHTKLYDETKDMNSYVTAIFLEEKLNQVQAASLVYATSDDNFKERAEILIGEHAHLYERLERNDLENIEGGYQSYDKWDHREWWTMEPIEGTENYRIVECFGVDMALPSVAEDEGYLVSPFEYGEAGVILYIYSCGVTDAVSPDSSKFPEKMLKFERNNISYQVNGVIIPMIPKQ